MMRPATITDADEIAVVHVTAWQAAYRGLMPDALLDHLSVCDRAARWRTILAKTGAERRSREWVIKQGGAVVGFSSVGESRDLDAPLGTAEIYAIYLVPVAWGKGLGRRLIGASLDELRATGYERVTLWVLAGNTRARSFYQASGLVLDGAEKTGHFGGTPLREVRYGLVLAQR